MKFRLYLLAVLLVTQARCVEMWSSDRLSELEIEDFLKEHKGQSRGRSDSMDSKFTDRHYSQHAADNKFRDRHYSQNSADNKFTGRQYPQHSADNKFKGRQYPQQCQTENTFMGIDYSMMGYNILYGYPMENGMDPGFRMPIFNKTFNHLMYTMDCKYMVPVGFDAEPSVSCITTFSQDEVKTEDSFSKSLSNQVTAEFKGWGAHFSSSDSYQKKTNDLSNSENTFIYSTAKCDYYMARLDEVSPPPLHNTFVEFLRQIQNTDNQTLYFELFDNFGTHYLKESHIGARYTHEYELTKEQYEHVSNSQYSVSEQAGYASVFSLSESDTLTSEQEAAAKEFSSSSTAHTITVGATPQAGGDQDAWASTVKNYPMPMEITLGSIEEIFEEQFFVGLDIDYERIRDNIIQFRKSYCWYIPMGDRSKNCVRMNEEEVREPAIEQYDGGPTYNQNCMTDQSFSGVSYAMMGYNIFKGYPMEPGLDPGYQHPIFNISFTSNKFTPDCMYRIPDGMDIVAALSCVTSFTADEATNEYEYSKSLSNEASTEMGGWGVHFSASSSYQNNVQEMNKGHSSYVYSTATCNYFYSRLDPYFPPPLHSSFVTYLQQLQSATDDEQSFFEFFDMFGTHYIKEAFSGARYTHEYMLTEDERSHAQQSSFSVETQAEYASVFSLSGGDKMSKDQQESAKDFTQHSTSTTITVGATPAPGDDPDAWASNVQQYPLPMKIVLGSIEEIFQPQFFQGVPVDYEAIRNAILKYKPEYCKSIEESMGLENVCKGEVPRCSMAAEGPHNIECLKHWWAAAGCNAEGSASPQRNDTSVNYWNSLDAGAAFKNMRTIKENADNDVEGYYVMCFGNALGCDLYGRPPQNISCMMEWWTNAQCQISGQLSPTGNDGYSMWHRLYGQTVRTDMAATRNGVETDDLSDYASCMDKGNICPVQGGPPQTENCIHIWWDNEGCFDGGEQSPKTNPGNLQRWMTMAAEDVRKEMISIHSKALDNFPQYAFEDCFGLTPSS